MAKLTFEDLLTKPFGNGGRLDPRVLWPDDAEDFEDGFDPDAAEEKLTGFLTEGYAKAVTAAITVAADQNEYARHWAYWRVFSEAYDAGVLLASSVSVEGEGSSSKTDAQLERLALLVAAEQAALDALADAVVAEPNSRPVTRSSYNATSQVRW